MKYQKDSSKREKSYFVPFTEIEKLEKIHQNFKKNEEFWAREQSDIKKAASELVKTKDDANLEKFPAIYCSSEGQAFFTFGYRNAHNKKINRNVVNLRGIKISPEEFKFFTTEHPMASYIEANSRLLNAQLWAGQNIIHSKQNMQAAYDDILMAYRIFNSKKDNTIQSKKVKI